jgi:hypothetical protein
MIDIAAADSDTYKTGRTLPSPPHSVSFWDAPPDIIRFNGKQGRNSESEQNKCQE